MQKTALPKRKSLFWDTDPTGLDVQKNAQYIIERILDFGNDDEVRWLFQQYPTNIITDVLKASRSQLHRKSRALWELVLR